MHITTSWIFIQIPEIDNRSTQVWFTLSYRSQTWMCVLKKFELKGCIITNDKLTMYTKKANVIK